MTWKRVFRIYLVLVLLGAYVLVVERASDDVDPKNLPPPVEESLLETEPAAIVALTFRRGANEVHAVGEDGRWHVLRPPHANVSSDLLSAVVGTLTAGQASEVMAVTSEVNLAEFGLVEPSSEIEVAFRDRGPAILVQLGAQNPTGTALYAKRSDRDAVFLVGLNVRYYVDLVLAGIGAPPPGSAPE